LVGFWRKTVTTITANLPIDSMALGMYSADVFLSALSRTVQCGFIIFLPYNMVMRLPNLEWDLS